MAKIILLVIVSLSLVFGTYFIFKKESVVISHSVQNLPNLASGSPAPTPYPFQEITIPALRANSFKSQLLSQELVFTRPGYNAYDAVYLSENLKIHGLLTLPNSEKPAGGFPAIVFVHGYIPPTLYKTQEKYVEYVDSFAKNGFVVFKIDLRGHGRSEGTPGGAYYSVDYIIDTLSAVSALRSSDFVNSNQIGLWGHSMAGNVISRSIVVDPSIKAAVIWAGAVYTYQDMVDFGINDQSYRPPIPTNTMSTTRQRIRDLYGTFKPDVPFWQDFPITRFIGEIKTPIQIHHAVDDQVVPVGYSRNLVKLLKEANIIHEYYEYQTGGHNITGTSFSNAISRTINFYKTNL